MKDAPSPAAAPDPAPPTRLTLSVRCAYCHDALARAEAAYCASCLAAHHRGCFAEHGRCSAPGCGCVEAVGRRPRRGVTVAVLLAGLTLGTVGGAALRPRSRPTAEEALRVLTFSSHGEAMDAHSPDPCVRNGTCEVVVSAGSVRLPVEIGHAVALEVVDDPDKGDVRVDLVAACPDGAHAPFDPRTILLSERGHEVSLLAGPMPLDITPAAAERVRVDVVAWMPAITRSPAAPD